MCRDLLTFIEFPAKPANEIEKSHTAEMPAICLTPSQLTSLKAG